MSANKTAQAIDAVVDRHDPGAVRRARASARSRDVVVNEADDESGTAALWGRLYATDAAVLDRRLTQMAQAVCHDDPRTLAQRRADALGALAAGADRLACGCGRPDCTAGADDERATSVVIHVVAEAAVLDAEPDRRTSGEPPDSEPDLPARPRPPAAHLLGGGTLPATMVAELVRGGAKVRPVRHPGEAPSEAGYRPSAELERFIRCRDMTCRFPGCDRPAEFADIDHTVPYPSGPTHASNLKLLCRHHRRIAEKAGLDDATQARIFTGPGAGGLTDRQRALLGRHRRAGRHPPPLGCRLDRAVRLPGPPAVDRIRHAGRLIRCAGGDAGCTAG